MYINFYRFRITFYRVRWPGRARRRPTKHALDLQGLVRILARGLLWGSLDRLARTLMGGADRGWLPVFPVTSADQESPHIPYVVGV